MMVKVNIINTWCILLTEEVTMQNLTITSTVSEESLARDTQIDRPTDRQRDRDRQTHTQVSVIFIKVCKVVRLCCTKREGTTVFFGPFFN